MSETKEFQERIGRIEGLVQKLESAGDPALRRTSRELVESLMAIHGAGLERILEIVSNAGEAGADLIESLANDPLISSLLVLYGLHPDDFETRVQRGLEKARTILRQQGARLEQVEIGDGSVHVKIADAGSNNLEAIVRDALLETAPDAADVAIEGGKPPAAASTSFVPLTSVRGLNGSPAAVANLTQP